MKHTGTCLCGGVRFEVEGEIGAVTLCHCGQCRKAQGSAFVAAAPVRRAAFRLLRGAELLTAFESSPGKRRVFCRVCGSPVFSERDADPDSLRLRIGLLDTPLGARPAAHIFCESRADWDVDLDQVARYPGLEPARANGGVK